MSIRGFTMLALSILSTLTVGCRSSLGPDDVAGTYVLERVGDDPLPAEVFRDTHGIVSIIADTMRLGTNGRGSFASVRIIDPVGIEAPQIPNRLDIALTFRIVGSRIEMEFICAPNALCIAGPHLIARQNARGLVVEASLVADAPLHYRRLPDFLLP